MLKEYIFGLCIFLFSLDARAFSFFQELQHFFSDSNNISFSDQNHLMVSPAEQQSILSHADGLDPKVLALAINAYQKLHCKGYDEQQILTIVDYSKPSTEHRLWVVDLKNLTVPFSELVAHGKNSGANFSTHFSDDPRSLQSSVGVYLTGDTYYGEHGYSLRLNGLESGFNDKARARSIVVHAANYVSEAFAKIHGRLGRSWGCFAVNPEISQKIIGNIKNGTVLFAYYPDPRWLRYSHYLKA